MTRSASCSGMCAPTSTWSRRATSSAAREIALTILSRRKGTTIPSRFMKPSNICKSCLSIARSITFSKANPRAARTAPPPWRGLERMATGCCIGRPERHLNVHPRERAEKILRLYILRL